MPRHADRENAHVANAENQLAAISFCCSSVSMSAGPLSKLPSWIGGAIRTMFSAFAYSSLLLSPARQHLSTAALYSRMALCIRRAKLRGEFVVGGMCKDKRLQALTNPLGDNGRPVHRPWCDVVQIVPTNDTKKRNVRP